MLIQGTNARDVIRLGQTADGTLHVDYGNREILAPWRNAQGRALVEQFGGARVGEHAVLREGHLLDGDPAAEAFPGRPHRLHPGQPVVGDHVGVGADVGGARCHHLLQ